MTTSQYKLDEILTCVNKQNTWRGKETLNMIASENALSRTAMKVTSSDFEQRYAEGLVGHRAYQGQQYHDHWHGQADLFY